MHHMKLLLIGAAAIGMLAGAATAQQAPGSGVTIYMQMGGNPGDMKVADWLGIKAIATG